LLHCVDPWRNRRRVYDIALRNLKPFPGRYVIHRQPSTVAAKTFPDRSLDFVFIDALHDEASVTEDLASWAPKVKVGGLITGHDYCRQFPGVVSAVDRWAARHGVPVILGAQSTYLIRKRDGN
jgi:hypothetical protein